MQEGVRAEKAMEAVGFQAPPGLTQVPLHDTAAVVVVVLAAASSVSVTAAAVAASRLVVVAFVVLPKQEMEMGPVSASSSVCGSSATGASLPKWLQIQWP